MSYQSTWKNNRHFGARFTSIGGTSRNLVSTLAHMCVNVLTKFLDVPLYTSDSITSH